MKMKQWMTNYFEEQMGRSATRRKKFHYEALEHYLIHEKYKSQLLYQEENGYNNFVLMMRELTEEGVIEPVKSSPKNGRFPSMPAYWWLLPMPLSRRWTDLQMLKVSHVLNLEWYREHPEWQTEEEWGKIETIYHFMNKGQSQCRLWVSKQERAFELFGQEKMLSYMTSNGRVTSPRGKR